MANTETKTVDLTIPRGVEHKFVREAKKLEKKFSGRFFWEKVGESVNKVDPVDRDVPTVYYDPTRKAYVLPVVVYRVTATLPKIPGWSYLGTVTFRDVGPIVHGFDKHITPDEAIAMTEDRHCDHCGHRRNRNFYVFIYNEETGEIKKVGSTCIKDFFGTTHPEMFFAFSLFAKKSWREDLSGCGGILYLYNLNSRVQFAISSIRHHGYCAIRGTGDPTAFRMVSEHTTAKYPLELKATKEEADEAIEWIRNRLDGEDASNSFIHNSKTIFDLPEDKYFGYRYDGTIAYWVNRWMTRDADEKRAEKKKQSQHVGEVGDFLEISGIITKAITRRHPRFRSWSTFMVIQGDDGNLYVGTTTNHLAESGKRITARVKIKEHSEFNGVKQNKVRITKIREISDA
ncbi:MAG: hypothetical protein D6698_08715 [Gammaproteobacteria bacterium]|nr:MAG: hypothetical protein D6698_08715 [Gammaproteobacteria bacterium]